MHTDVSDTVLRRVLDAAARLHVHDWDPTAVTDTLEHLVVELGLAEEAAFTPSVIEAMAQRTDPDAQGDVVVRRPDGTEEGRLRCRGLGGDSALWGVRVLADHAGAALAAGARVREAGRRERALRAISEELQDALLPSLPSIPGTSIDVVYRAASAEARVGGDFYDVLLLRDGRVLLVVGDVVGKGVEAASRTARITHTLRALVLAGYGLAELLEACDDQISFQDPEIMATVWCGLYEPTTGELEFASLGHPPALLERADGQPIHLTLEGLPLGLRDLASEPPEIRTRRLASRDLLLLYTDGVVEASGDYLAGQDALRDAVQTRRDEPLTDLIDGVIGDLLQGAGHRDDAVVLALRRR